MRAMEDNVPRADSRAARFSGAAGGVLGEDAAAFSEKMAARMEGFEKSLTSLTKEVSGGAITMGGFTFDGLESCIHFVNIHIPTGDFSLIYDVVSLSHATRGDYVTTKENADEANLTHKTGFKSVNEANVAAAMSTMLPFPYGVKGKLDARVPLPGLGPASGFEFMQATGAHKEYTNHIRNVLNELRGVVQCEVAGYSASGIRLVSALIEKAASDAAWMLDNVGC